jgi:hypothetical protein
VAFSQAGQVATKAALLDTVGADTVVGEAVLTTCLSQVRQALGEYPRQPRYIATVHRLGYRFLAPVTADRPEPLPEPPPLLVGRAAELAQLHTCFAQARHGTRQTVFVTGETGVGKTTLVEAFLAQVEAASPGRICRGQCIEHYGAGEAYLPLLDALGRLGRAPDGDRLMAWPDGTVSGRYGFRHALYQEVMYKRLNAGHRAAERQVLRVTGGDELEPAVAPAGEARCDAPAAGGGV